jgi:hypothetical protein
MSEDVDVTPGEPVPQPDVIPDEPAPPPFKLEIGRCYRACNGWITGPLFETPNDVIREWQPLGQPFAGQFNGETSGEYWTWRSDGKTWSGKVFELMELADVLDAVSQRDPATTITQQE